MHSDTTGPTAVVSSGKSTIGVEAWAQPALLTVIACLAMALATTVYLTDRDATRAMLMPRVRILFRTSGDQPSRTPIGPNA